MTQPTRTTPNTFTSADDAVEAGRQSTITATHLGPARWSNDAFLDGLRQFGDPAADRCAMELAKDGNSAAVAREVFAHVTQNCQRLPDTAPAALKQFFAETYAWCSHCRQPSLPEWVDRDRLLRGQDVFMERLVPSVLVLLCKSLPEGYAAAGATKILNISGDLLAHTYHRLMGTLQLLVNVSSEGSFERAGTALINAQQMRLLHAGVRCNVAPKVLDRRDGAGAYDAYIARHGMPINQEDLLATIMAFSLLVVRGLRTLNVPLTNKEAEDFYYVWRVFAHLMGIHPPGDPTNESHLPESLTEAERFYEAYCRRQYAGSTQWTGDWLKRSLEENPDGCKLAERHLAMLGTVLPERPSRFLHLPIIAKLYVEMLIGPEACARVGIARLDGHQALRFLVMRLPRWWALYLRKLDRGIHERLSEWFLRTLLQQSYKRGVVFTVPSTVEDLKDLVQDGVTPR